MNNQKGLTLLEVIATLTISMVVLGVAFLLYGSVNQLFHSSSQTYNDKASMNLTMNTIAKRLTDANKAVYISGNNELRFTNGLNYYSLWFATGSSTLTLYSFSDDGDNTNNVSGFTDQTIGFINNPTLYSKPIELSALVTGISYSLLDTKTLISGEVYAAGEHLVIEVFFDFTRVTAGGGKVSDPTSESIVIKLMEDQTAK